MAKFYVTNEQIMDEWHKSMAQDKMTEQLGKYMLMIAENYSHHRWFVGYSFRDDMVAEALVTLCKNWRKFNPEKSNNPFAYWTTAVHRVFQGFKANELNQRNIRDKLLVDQGDLPSFSYQERHGMIPEGMEDLILPELEKEDFDEGDDEE